MRYIELASFVQIPAPIKLWLNSCFTVGQKVLRINVRARGDRFYPLFVCLPPKEDGTWEHVSALDENIQNLNRYSCRNNLRFLERLSSVISDLEGLGEMTNVQAWVFLPFTNVGWTPAKEVRETLKRTIEFHTLGLSVEG
ncbi:MAG: hypothetical protein WCV58_04210 [Patescibacteria group bacterium]